MLVPIIRDACTTAGESIVVCNVFTQWSQQLVEQIRVEGLTGAQLQEAVHELKRNFYREHMENHWLLPSISPLLSLTAQEFEKSRENSISVDPKSADDALQLIRNEHASRDNARSNNGIYDSGKKNSKVSEEPLERLLNDAEENIVQLERQLHMVQRKTNENEKLNESTRKRVDQLLYRLSSTAHSMQKEDTRNHDEELKRKLTMNSDLSLARIEDNTHKCTRERSEIEPEAQAETKINNEDPQSDKDANFHKEMPVDHSDANNIGATEENSSCSQIIDDLHVDEELNQIYWECTRLLGRPKYMSYDCKDETVVVKKKLILEIMDCIRKLMTALIAQKNEINVNCNSEDGDETCSNLLSDAFSESKKNNSSMINEEKDVKNLTVRDITAEKHEHHQLTKIHEKDENISENAEENKGVELEEFSNAEHKNEDNNDKERSKDGCDKKNERQALDGSIDKEHALQVKIIEIPLELNNEVTQSYENTSNGNHESRVVSFEDGSPNRNDLHSNNSTIIDTVKINVTPKTAKREYRISYKHHIQSHINTATRTAGGKQAVSQHQQQNFLSPTMTRKPLLGDAEVDQKTSIGSRYFV